MGLKTAINHEPVTGVSAVADDLSVTSLTIHNYIRAGFFPGAFQLPTGVWRIPVRDVKALRQKSKVTK